MFDTILSISSVAWCKVLFVPLGMSQGMAKYFKGNSPFDIIAETRPVLYNVHMFPGDKSVR